MWFNIISPISTDTAAICLIVYEGIPSTYIINLLATFGSNAVKNISFGDNTAILYFV
jgi:hypothetical protein